MNQQGLFGPFMFVPYVDQKKEEIDEQRGTKEMYSVQENMNKGNIFKNEYLAFEKYQVMLNNPKNERERLMREIQENSLAAHDLRLHLDIHPDDKEIFNKFSLFAAKANELIKEYENKFGVIVPGSAIWEGEKSSYNKTPSVWVE